MDTIEFYYKISEGQKGEIIDIPKHPGLKSYLNYDQDILVPKDAEYAILRQIGLYPPSIMWLDKEEYPVVGGHEKFIFGAENLAKRLDLALEKVDSI